MHRAIKSPAKQAFKKAKKGIADLEGSNYSEAILSKLVWEVTELL